MSKLQAYTEEWLTTLCQESFSYAEVLRKAGRKQSGGNQSHLKKRIEDFGIDTSHFTGQNWRTGLTMATDSRITSKEKYSIEEIFIENSKVDRKIIRSYVVRHNLIPYQCSCCGNKGEWLGEKMALELDHINGVSNDHRLNNLRWLCPNCHSITKTYGAKNITRD